LGSIRTGDKKRTNYPDNPFALLIRRDTLLSSDFSVARSSINLDHK
jgi:hypothetical protein